MTVTLRDRADVAVWSTTLDPKPVQRWGTSCIRRNFRRGKPQILANSDRGLIGLAFGGQPYRPRRPCLARVGNLDAFLRGDGTDAGNEIRCHQRLHAETSPPARDDDREARGL